MIKTLQNTLRQDKEQFTVPRSVQDTIPIRRIWPDGIFQFGSKFSKCIRFSDINYAIASKEDKTAMFLNYSELLNALDTGSTTKITINNKRLNRQNFEETILLPPRGDFLDGYRAEYNTMLTDKVTDAVSSVVQERYITVSTHKKNVDEARTFFDRVTNDITSTDEQNDMLDDLLENLDLLGGAIGNLAVTEADAKELLASLPADLSAERREIIETACQLVGKVNYFWGGKSLVLGWDSRWGTTMQVTAPGSSTTGTYRPYGMDCSGYVDWVFYNATGGEYIIGHGGGASAQHSYCTAISWDEAMPGDLVFYPEDSHVGIVGGRDESGNLLIIHCASGYNNVVITGIEGFTSIGRPVYFSD